MLLLLCIHRYSSLNSTAIAGETALDRLANALGGKAILPHIIRTIPQMLVSGELSCALVYSLLTLLCR